MKTSALILAAALFAPVLASAQTSQPLTRAEVRAELAALVKVGYHPGAGNNPHYPDQIQEAQARLHAAQGDSGYGANPAAGVESGMKLPAATGDLYRHR
ncbi:MULTISPECIES: DUF4148 domain-containing protein [Burkholderia]|uniref:DUF4148 domain-containing protein n=1 Tax=Burkholderia TaxID=32008 RepID=UPI00050E6468|nr:MULTISPECIES: DUF4148 domain-containing protein [Burkholderia]KGE12144.1 hypothetical protein LA03_01435 [Burkholderia gladioli]NBI49117.1 DUF4148 domain-containing protein [Burkholderia sp. ISTR5]